MGYKYHCVVIRISCHSGRANNLFDELYASDADPKVSLSAPVLNDSHSVEDAWFPQALANGRELVVCCFQA
jgi:hypothetical protein